MNIIIAYVAISAICTEPKSAPFCATYANGQFRDEKSCVEFVKINNEYWKKTKIKGQMYCIQSSIAPATR